MRQPVPPRWPHHPLDRTSAVARLTRLGAEAQTMIIDEQLAKLSRGDLVDIRVKRSIDLLLDARLNAKAGSEPFTAAL